MSNVARFSVSVNPQLLEEFDKLTAEVGSNRSMAVESAMRGYLVEHKWTMKDNADVAGALILFYDHHVRGVMEVLTQIQHDYIDIIYSTTHIHLEHNICLEIIAVRGQVKKLKSLKKSIESIKGVKQLQVSIMNI